MPFVSPLSCPPVSDPFSTTYEQGITTAADMLAKVTLRWSRTGDAGPCPPVFSCPKRTTHRQSSPETPYPPFLPKRASRLVRSLSRKGISFLTHHLLVSWRCFVVRSPPITGGQVMCETNRATRRVEGGRMERFIRARREKDVSNHRWPDLLAFPVITSTYQPPPWLDLPIMRLPQIARKW